MNPSCEMIVYAIFIFSFIAHILSRDEHYMDDYDKYQGIADEGRTRGMFGTIYNSDGTYSFWYNLIDTNPIWTL